MPLARHLARHYQGGGEREDLEQVAALGLVKAIDRFDPARGVAFTSYAVPTIVGEIKRYFRDLGWSVRVPRELQELAARAERETDRMTSRLGRVPTTVRGSRGRAAPAWNVCWRYAAPRPRTSPIHSTCPQRP